jgi:hypothetical protein
MAELDMFKTVCNLSNTALAVIEAMSADTASG